MKNSARRGGGSGVVLLVALGLAACSDDATNVGPSADASTLDGHVVPHDAGHGVDANCANAFAGCASDDAALPDDAAAGEDADATDDAEATSDAAADAGADAPADATVDAAADTGTPDTGADAAIDSGPDAAPVDSGVDAGVDAAIDSGVDAGVDAAPPVDAGITCAAGQVLCNGACIDPNTNASFCGASGACSGRLAGTACTAGQVCGGGACATLAPKRVFVTAAAVPASRLLSAANADAQCQRTAPARPAGTWKAWLSDAVSSPATRFSRAGSPYRLLDGTTVAEDWAGLTSGTLKTAINLSERNAAPAGGTLSAATANKVGGPFNVFTGTKADGTSASTSATNYTCGGWTSASATAAVAVGASTAVTSAWSNGSEGLYCADTAAIYCVEQ